MITEIETALAEYLTDALDADTALGTAITAARVTDTALPDPAWVAKAATSQGAAPKNKTLVAVAAASSPQIFDELRNVIVHVHIMTPAEPAALGGLHTHFEQAIERAFSAIDTPTVADDIGDAITARLTDWDGGGIVAKGWQPGREGGAYAPHFEVEIGLVRAAP